jgi:hypothetical protein
MKMLCNFLVDDLLMKLGIFWDIMELFLNIMNMPVL